MQIKNRKLILAALLLAPALLLVGCGGGAGDSGTDGSSSAGAPATTSSTHTTPPSTRTTAPSTGTTPTSSTNSQPETTAPPSTTNTTPTGATGTVRSYVYVAEDRSSTVAGYSLGATANDFTTLGTTTLAGQSLPDNIMVHPSGRFIYVSNRDVVTAHRVDPSTGALVLVSVTRPDGSWSMTASMTNSGRFLCVSRNYSVDDAPPLGIPPAMSTYRIDADTGDIVLAGTIVTGKNASSIVAARASNIAFVLSQIPFSSTPTTLSAYSIDPETGSLALVAETVADGKLAVHPDGMHAYLAGGGAIATYTLDTGAGMLTTAGIPVPTGVATAIAVHPNGNFLYVANRTELWTYRIDPVTGAPIAVGTPLTISEGPNPGLFGAAGNPIGFDASGKLLYVAGVRNLSTYNITPVTGLPVPAGPPTPRGLNAIALAVVNVVDPSSGP